MCVSEDAVFQYTVFYLVKLKVLGCFMKTVLLLASNNLPSSGS